MDSDDAADIIQDLPEERKERILSEIEDQNQAQDIKDLLLYDEDSAGGLMGKEFIKVNENWITATCVKEMRQQAQEKEIEEIYSIYVVDEDEKLLGTLSLKNLITASPRSKIQTLFKAGGVQSVTPEMKGEEVANIMKKYDLPAIPVVDHDNVLIGMGSIVMDDCVIESNSIIAAGAVVTKNTRVEAGSIYAGIPAKKVKDISKELISNEIERIANNYVKYSSWYD